MSGALRCQTANPRGAFVQPLHELETMLGTLGTRPRLGKAIPSLAAERAAFAYFVPAYRPPLGT